MRPPTHIFGDATSVAERFGSENAAIRPERLMDVTCVNTSGALKYMQVHEIAPGAAGAVAPAEGAVPKFSFPVQAGLGGTLGQEADLKGIYCCWSSTQATKTIAGASGEINIIVRA